MRSARRRMAAIGRRYNSVSSCRDTWCQTAITGVPDQTGEKYGGRPAPIGSS